MNGHDAASAQYATPTATPTLGPPVHGPSGLPHTGYAVAWPLAIGVVLIAAGTFVRGLIGGRS